MGESWDHISSFQNTACNNILYNGYEHDCGCHHTKNISHQSWRCSHIIGSFEFFIIGIFTTRMIRMMMMIIIVVMILVFYQIFFFFVIANRKFFEYTSTKMNRRGMNFLLIVTPSASTCHSIVASVWMGGSSSTSRRSWVVEIDVVIIVVVVPTSLQLSLLTRRRWWIGFGPNYASWHDGWDGWLTQTDYSIYYIARRCVCVRLVSKDRNQVERALEFGMSSI